MSLNAAALKIMADKGLSIADVIEIAEAMEKKADRTNAERQARHRAKRNAVTVTRDPPNDIDISNPLTSETKVSSVSKRGRAKPTPDVPNDIPAEPWTEFELMRTAKRKPLNDFSRKQLWGRLRSIRDAGWNIEDVMAKAIVSQHDGFWMPDGRDSNIRRANEPRAGPFDMEEYRAKLARVGKADG